ncbi:MAG: type II toxin-antitoxin system HipA family toxin [Epsilonproteobacteria bacterium]|nr:type II toxin-antitoxin system HipA family toxin [Campylobacterota bacterium]
MIQTVDVYLEHCGEKYKVGKLAIDARKIYFEYESEFLGKNINISPYLLPLKSELFSCEDRVFEGLFGVFGDSLPDGWGRLLLDRHLAAKGIAYQNITALDRLCYVGKYGIGALSYEPTCEVFLHSDGDIILDDLAKSSLRVLEGKSTMLLDELLAMQGSSSGARPKIMVQIDSDLNMVYGNQILNAGFEHYMVKFPNSLDGIHSGKIEYIYSLMAKKAGIQMSDTELLHGDKNSYFTIKRFDRVADQKVHIHSVCGLTHSDFRMPSLDYDDLLTLTFHITKDLNEVKKMFRVAVFNLLTHNRDDHGKNFLFLLDCNNSWKLSPAYDLTFSSGPNGEHSTTYLGEGKNPTLEHLEKLAQKHTIKEYKMIIKQIQDAVAHFGTFAKDVELPKNEMTNIGKILSP